MCVLSVCTSFFSKKKIKSFPFSLLALFLGRVFVFVFTLFEGGREEEEEVKKRERRERER